MIEEKRLGDKGCAHPTVRMVYAPPNGRWVCDTCPAVFDLALQEALDKIRREAAAEAWDRLADEVQTTAVKLRHLINWQAENPYREGNFNNG